MLDRILKMLLIPVVTFLIAKVKASENQFDDQFLLPLLEEFLSNLKG